MVRVTPRLLSSITSSITRPLDRHRELPAAAIALVVHLAGLAPVPAEDWPQFRGNNASGVSSESDDLPVKFSATEKVLWSTKLGEGVASPVIYDGRLYVTSMVAEQKFAVFAFDARTGKQLWRSEFDTGPLPEITTPNTHASCTPAVDGQRVYVHFSTLGLLGLDAETGKLVWKHPVALPFYLLGWGAANSPIVYENMVIFNLDDDLSPFLLAVDKYTGKTIWRSERPEMLGGYAVPVVVKASGREDIVVAGSGKLKGYDPSTGKERWTCNTLLRTIMTSPVVRDDKIYVSLQSYGDADRVLKFALLQWKDTNQDGRLEKSEFDKAFWDKFDRGDKDRDGFLVDDEIDDAFQAASNRVGGGNIIQAIRGGGSGDVTKTHLVWNLDNKSPSNIASPLVVGDQLFVVKKGGISASFSAADGKKLWSKKRIRNLGNYYASPIAGDGKIYVMGENGYLVVLQQGAKLKILGRNDMGETTVATPAIADNRIFVRTLNQLFCISNEAR